MRLIIDGKVDAEQRLAAPAPSPGLSIRIGYTSSDFPEPPVAFTGDIEYVRFDARSRSLEEMRAARTSNPSAAVAIWDLAQLAGGRVLAGTDGRFSATLERLSDPRPVKMGLALACLGSELPTWDLSTDHSVRLQVPAGVQPLSFQLVYAPLAAGEIPEASARTWPLRQLPRT